MSLDKKRLSLESRIAKLGSVLVAFSGGVDSTVVLAVAHKVLGNRVLAVTAESESVPARELEVAHQLTRVLGIQHLVIPTEETSLPEYLRNPENRCYYCRRNSTASCRKSLPSATLLTSLMESTGMT